MRRPRSKLGLYVVLAVAAAGLVGINIEGFGEHLRRNALESDGVIVQGRIVDHMLARCSGFRCSQRVTFDGEINSERYRNFRRSCGTGQRWCHSDLLVSYDYAKQRRQLVGAVSLRDFERLKDGSTVMVLADAKNPSRSMLRDYEPEGFLFYVAILVDALVALIGFAIFGAIRGSKNGSGYRRV